MCILKRARCEVQVRLEFGNIQQWVSKMCVAENEQQNIQSLYLVFFFATHFDKHMFVKNCFPSNFRTVKMWKLHKNNWNSPAGSSFSRKIHKTLVSCIAPPIPQGRLFLSTTFHFENSAKMRKRRRCHQWRELPDWWEKTWIRSYYQNRSALASWSLHFLQLKTTNQWRLFFLSEY